MSSIFCIIISPEYSLEGLMLKLKLQYFVYLKWRTDSLEKTLMLGKIKGRRRRGQQRMDGWMVSPTQWTCVWVDSRTWWCHSHHPQWFWSPRKENLSLIPFPPLTPSICREVMGLDAVILVFRMLNFKQLFYSPLSPSSRGSLVPLHFLPLG